MNAGRARLGWAIRVRGGRRLALPLATAANFAVGAVYVVVLALLLITGRTRGADFTAFYTGWRIVLEGHGSQLYDTALQSHVQQAILGGQTFQAGLNPFNNPPYMVLPFGPLGLRKRAYSALFRDEAKDVAAIEDFCGWLSEAGHQTEQITMKWAQSLGWKF